jgi:hypothetical protein
MRFFGIIFNITYDCNLNCPHCFYYPKSRSRTVISPKRVKEIILSTKDSRPVKTAHFTGGEPFLYYDSLLKMVEIAKKLDVRRITFSTNCFWANNIGKVRKQIGRLKKAGLTWFLISADAFHQEKVPIENVRRVALVRKELGLQGNDDLSVVCFVNKDYPHPYNKKTLAIAKRIISWGHGASLHPSMPYGKASQFIPEDACSMTGPKRKCWQWRTWGFIHPQGPHTVFIGPDEFVNVCYGVSLGNLKNKSLFDLLKDFEKRPNPIIKALLDEGVAGLVKKAQSYGWNQKLKFQNECHLCYAVRIFLKKYEPEFLQPDECYPSFS